MNPFPMLLADLRAMRGAALAIIILVALSVAAGVGISAAERSFRKSTAAAVDDFDLIIAAPGSPTQVLLNTVFLRPDAAPLMDGAVFLRALRDPRAAGATVIAPGDVAQGYAMVGTTAAFATRWGRIAPAEGRIFAEHEEAVVGADVALALGAKVEPSHGHAGSLTTPGQAQPEEAEHRHAGAGYRIVGRLPRLGTPWDRAILTPLESVWQVHGLLSEDKHETGASFETFLTRDRLPPAPAVVIKVRSVADAYGLRASFRQAGLMAFFPAEVLVSLYDVLGDIRTVLVVATALNAVLIFAAILLLLWVVASLRRRRYAILRALGAPRRFILVLIWLQSSVLLGLGCVLGLGLGLAASRLASGALAASTGLAGLFSFDAGDFRLVAIELAVAAGLSLLPAWRAFRQPVAENLR